ncbi:MAG: TRAP transporter large permease subunit [Pararhodobacter sp.]|nr:TRAP transporter large permease subunit [Pararhodobacter sp.]
MVAALLAGIFAGYPVAFVLGGVGVLFALITGTPLVFLSTGISRIYSGTLTNWLLIAIPLFVFMGLLLEKSGVARKLLFSMAGLLGGLPGGYAFAVCIIGIVMAASTGIVGASVVLLALLALPVMKQTGYDMRIASGVIAASGTLGILIPPSVMLIILGDTLNISVGGLFAGAMVPGVLLGLLYILYLLGVAVFRPSAMPPARNVSAGVPLTRRLVVLLGHLIAPLALICAVLGSIIAGIATPTESAALGAAGALLLAIMGREMSWRDFFHVLTETSRTTAMILFVMIGATMFSVIFRRVGGDRLIHELLLSMGTSPYTVMLTIMVLIFVLGMVLDWVEITLVVVPLVAPVVALLDFGMTPELNLLWFAIVFAVNLQTSFLTPPFGFALFYLRGVGGRDLPMGTIYSGVAPFVGLQILCLGLVLAFPQLVLWLPELTMRR